MQTKYPQILQRGKETSSLRAYPEHRSRPEFVPLAARPKASSALNVPTTARPQRQSDHRYGVPHDHSGKVHHGSSLEHGWALALADRRLQRQERDGNPTFERAQWRAQLQHQLFAMAWLQRPHMGLRKGSVAGFLEHMCTSRLRRRVL